VPAVPLDLHEHHERVQPARPSARPGPVDENRSFSGDQHVVGPEIGVHERVADQRLHAALGKIAHAVQAGNGDAVGGEPVESREILGQGIPSGRQLGQRTGSGGAVEDLESVEHGGQLVVPPR